MADAEYLAREIAALRLALGEVATRDYLRGELRDAVEEITMALTNSLERDENDGGSAPTA